MNNTGSATQYRKSGKTSRTAGKNSEDARGERLASRMLMSTAMGGVDPEMRAQGWYKPEPPSADYPTSPRGKVHGSRNTTTSSGLASRGNVMHTRYLRTTP